MKKPIKIHWVSLLFNLSMLLLFFAFSISSKGEFLIIAFIGMAIFISFVKAQEKTFVSLLYLCVAMFMLGQRTIYIGQAIRISPALALCAYLFLLLLIFQKRPSGALVRWFLPSGYLYLLGVLFGLVTAFLNRLNMNFAIAYGILLVCAFPIFYVVHALVKDIGIVRKIFFVLIVTAFLNSLLGMAEYVGIRIPLLSGWYGGTIMQEGEAGPMRASATFWGGPMLAGYLALILPLIISFFNIFRKSSFLRFFMVFSFLSCIAFIFFSGYRGIWIAVLAGLMAYSFYRGKKEVTILLGLILMAYHFAAPFIEYRIRGLDPESAVGTSAYIRRERMQGALVLIREHPFVGIGLAGSGLVHSDIIQFASDNGILTSLLFMIFYIKILNRLRKSIRSTRDPELAEYRVGVFASLFGFFFSFFIESYLNLPEVYVPFWFMLAIGFVLARLPEEEAEVIAINENDPASQERL
ncbi:MAG: O-antigen ligase family protein [Candidatus Omnitrophota bacterium]